MTFAMKIQEERKEERKAMLNDIVISMLNRHKSPDFIADALDISLDKVKSIAEANGIALQP